MYNQKIQELRELIGRDRRYGSIVSAFRWEIGQKKTPKGDDYRQTVIEEMSKESLALIKSDKAKGLYDYFKGVDNDTYENDYEKGMVRAFLNNYETMTKIPVETQIELIRANMEGQNSWEEAREKNDFSIFEPKLKNIFELKKKVATIIDDTQHPLSVLTNQIDEGIEIEELENTFAELRDGIIKIREKIAKSDVELDSKVLDIEYEKEDLMDFVMFLTQEVGFDTKSGSYGETIHPFCTSMGPKDVRLALNYNNFKGAIFAGIHEAGHGMYSQRGNEHTIENHLWGGMRGGFHESQARFYENIVARSKQFWTYYYPEVQKRFPQFKDVSLDEFYKTINKTESSLIRIRADELTYNLHIIIRFELEKAVFDGKLEISELPKAWNEKYKEYLGVEPSNDVEGVMQDMHWGSGLMGYFQSYTLGNLYATQIYNQLIKEMPNVYDDIEKGDFNQLNSWLRDKVHQYGSTYSPIELLEKVTGEKLQAKYFLDYLENKYLDIYEVK